MLDISNNNIITMTRGDYVKIPLKLFYSAHDKLTNINYYINKHDKIYFAIMEHNQSFEDAIVKKVFSASDVRDDGSILVELEGIETEYLTPGEYFYQVKMLRKIVWKETEDNEGRPETIIGKTKFIIID